MTFTYSRTALSGSLLALAIVLAGCGIKPEPAEINPTDMPKGPGLFSGESGNILDAFKSKDGEGGGPATLGVNTYLWRASLETLSFLPIKTADSTGGVIGTDWYSAPGKTDERIRANVLIKGKKLQASALQVTLFKQTRDAKGEWVDGSADPASARALEDTILTKARALRVRDQAE